VAERVAAYVRDHRAEYALICTTQDWHVDPGGHFSQTPDYVDTWPPHGLAGTPSADLHPALTGLTADVAVKKGQYQAAYSGFEGADAAGLGLEEILRGRGVDAVDVVGLAESHCVAETALDAVKIGFSARVLTALTEPVSPETGRVARERMTAAGVELV
jgi:nicotinamidase/pyrazinamidase